MHKTALKKNQLKNTSVRVRRTHVLLMSPRRPGAFAVRVSESAAVALSLLWEACQ